MAVDDFISTPAALPRLGDEEIHLWRLALGESANFRDVSSAARCLLDHLLAHYGGLASAPEIERGEHGKPFAPSLPGIDFNLSHARDHVLIAVARAQPLGVDIEHIDRKTDVDGLARRFFAASEAEALRGLPEAQRLEAFVRLWTCKEAVLKALGEGLAFGLDRVAFALDGAGVPTGLSALAAEAGDSDAWQLALLEPAPGFLGALAWRGGRRAIRAFVAADA
ncbi:MAG TPA: 4'-phosphopantetheinyl transferase superfamily protein [Rhodanobacteraceae bacterium]|nr:4'-phosphopantetheinyl transferase superfamily protein [Rhodanobacteraceae bacterium]